MKLKSLLTVLALLFVGHANVLAQQNPDQSFFKPITQRVKIGDMLRVSFFLDYSSQAGQPYRLGIQDVVRIVVQDKPELSISATVQPDGSISVPDAGEVQVQNLTLPEFRDVIQKHYMKTLSTFTISATLESSGVLARNFVETIGEGKSGVIDAQINANGMLELPLIPEIQAMGMAKTDLYNKIDSMYRAKFRYVRAYTSFKNNASNKITVLGEVRSPGVFPWEGDVNLIHAIGYAGGLLTTAKDESIILIRMRDGEVLEGRKINLVDYLYKKQNAQDLTLHPGDIVYVPNSTVAKVNDFIDKYIRRMIPINLGAGAYYNIPNGQK